MHGLSVPLGKLGYHLPRTLSSAIASRSISEDAADEPRPPFRILERIQDRTQSDHQRNSPRKSQRAREEPPRPVFRIGGSIIHDTASENALELQTTEAARERVPRNHASSEINISRDDGLDSGP